MKRILLSILVATMMTICLSPFQIRTTRAATDTGFEFNPLPNGGSMNYWTADVTGIYHYDTHMLDGWTYKWSGYTRITSWEMPGFCPHFYGSQSAWASYRHLIGTPDDLPLEPPDWPALLTLPAVSPNGTPYMGEVGGWGVNAMNVNLPPEGILTKNPVVGEVIDGHSVIYNACDGSVVHPDYHWRLQTTGIYPNHYNGRTMVRTDLLEYNTEVGAQHDTAFVYQWIEGIGLYFMVWGEIDPTTRLIVPGTGHAAGAILE